MTHEKRLLLALILSVLLCTWWAQRMSERQRQFRLKQIEAKKKADEAAANQKKPGQLDPVKPDQPDPVKPDQPDPVKPDQPDPVKPDDPLRNPDPATLDAIKPEDGEYENDVYWLEWTNRGAALKQLKFKRFWYGTSDKKAADWQRDSLNWLNIIPDFSSEMPSLLVFDNTKAELDKACWKVIRDPNNPDQLEFELATEGGITYRKSFTFHPSEYAISGKITVVNDSPEEKKRELRLTGGTGIVLESPDYTYLVAHAMYRNARGEPVFEKYSYSDLIKEKVQLKTAVSWAAMTNRYFAHVLEIEDPSYIASMGVRAISPDVDWVEKSLKHYKQHGDLSHEKSLKQRPKQAAFIFNTQTLTIPAKKEGVPGELSIKFKFYIAGKNDLSKLKDHSDFQRLHDYGMLEPIILVILWILGLFYRIFHDYGIAIICLTIAIKLVLYPLSRKQQVAMQEYQKKMGLFQPQMKRLQEKYKNDRRKLQEELMNLYKQHGVSPIPLAGCLPILIQLPIFIALYTALAYSMELRQATFLWIDDLSQPDRIWQFGANSSLAGFELNILPLVMTIIWFIQMKTAPMPQDPQMQQQQKIMMIMPFIFGFIFYSFASGLVLYWLVMQLITVMEQFWIKKTHA